MRSVYHTKDQLFIKHTWGWCTLIRETNDKGLYDITLIKDPTFWGSVDGMLLYEDLTSEQWKILRRSSELESIFEKAEELFVNAENDSFSMC